VRIPSADQQHFSRIPQSTRPRSSWMRPSRHKHTFDEGYLIPFYVDDVIPGDTFNVNAQMFARLATPIFPIMDNMYLETFWFFVPNRLVWDNFVRQHGERPNPDSSVDFTTPVITVTGVTPAVMSLWDNFGLPMGGSMQTAGMSEVSALPFRGYYLIWNEWFRDQDLQDSLTVATGDGPDLYSAYGLQRINKYFDYFTGCRPAPQKGDAVELPLGGFAPVWGTQKTNIGAGTITLNNSPIGGSGLDRATTDGETYGPLMNNMAAGALGGSYNVGARTTSSTGSGNVTNAGDFVFLGEAFSKSVRAAAEAPLEADLSQAAGTTVNAFREAVTIQQVYELDMRGGTRFIEMVFNHFGVINPDFRLQRPEFLGHSKSPVNIHPVPQTSESGASTPQGNLSAFGTVSSHRNGFIKSFTEHGYVFGLVCVRGDLTYQNGLDRHWSRQTRFDYYYPAFANLGEQAVLRKELDVDLTGADNDLVFGYQERWAEYRFKTSKITGLFRSNAASSLDSWHIAQELTDPVLNETFIQEDAPVDRVIAVTSEPHFIFDCVVNNHTARVMPSYSVPGLMRI